MYTEGQPKAAEVSRVRPAPSVFEATPCNHLPTYANLDVPSAARLCWQVFEVDSSTRLEAPSGGSRLMAMTQADLAALSDSAAMDARFPGYLRAVDGRTSRLW